MEKSSSSSNLLPKLCRLLPSSCQSRALKDVEHSSIIISTKPQNHNKNNHDLLRKYPSLPKSKKVTPTPFPSSSAAAEKVQKFPPPVASSSNSAQWFSSSDENEKPPRVAAGDDAFETDTFYSLSSNSGESFRRKAGGRSRRRCKEMESIDDQGATRLYYMSGGRRRSCIRRQGRKSLGGVGECDGAVAVEKTTSDPYGDFMASMVEMVIEKQIFRKEDLDRLLLCFLSLNKEEYHGIIFQVFTEICQTLFFN